jgi:hypothetical protein
MKKLLKITSFVLTLVLYLAPTTEAEANICDVNPLGEVVTDIEDVGACTVTPDYASFPLFKLGLCSKIPTYESYQTDCTFIVDNDAAQNLEIIKGNSLKITDDISLLPGSYPAAVILLGNEISLKHTVVFYEDDYYGWAGGIVTAGGIATEGDTCATTTSEGSEDDISGNFGGFFSCGGDDIVAGWFTETSGAYLAEDGNGDPATCSISAGAIVESSSELAFSTASGDTVVCGMDDASTLETYESDDTPNATRQLVVQTFTDPVVISNDSTSIDLGIKLENMLSLEMHVGPNNNLDDLSLSPDSYINGFIDGIEFKVVVK